MAKNLVQMSVDGILYDIRDQRMAMRLDTLNSSLMLALDHKQNADTAVVIESTVAKHTIYLTQGIWPHSGFQKKKNSPSGLFTEIVISSPLEL